MFFGLLRDDWLFVNISKRKNEETGLGKRKRNEENGEYILYKMLMEERRNKKEEEKKKREMYGAHHDRVDKVQSHCCLALGHVLSWSCVSGGT